jgi:hypothetical protein
VCAGRVLDRGNADGPDGRAVTLGEQHAVLSESDEPVASGDQRDVVPGLVQARGVEAAENPRTVDEDFHAG